MRRRGIAIEYDIHERDDCRYARGSRSARSTTAGPDRHSHADRSLRGKNGDERDDAHNGFPRLVVQMLASGVIAKRGAVLQECNVPADTFPDEIENLDNSFDVLS